MEAIADKRFRVFFITEEDPLYTIRFFEVFLAEYPRAELQIIGATLAKAFNEPLTRTARRLLQFYGPKDFLRVFLWYAQVRIGGQNNTNLFKQYEVPIIETGSVNEANYVSTLRALKLDLIVSVAAPQIFKKELLSSARLGCINIHSGRLPCYRGMMPIFWQLLAGEKTATVTIHEMVEKLDAGGIIT